MKDTLIDLWNGRLMPCTNGIPSEEMTELKNYIEKHFQKLYSKLNEDERQTLTKLEECQNDLIAAVREEAFVQGFSIGTKMMTEALSK